LPVMRVEALTLRQIFGPEYDSYAQNVPLFLPRITAYAKGGNAEFDTSLYMRYREYRAALGLVIAWSLLAFKTYFLR